MSHAITVTNLCVYYNSTPTINDLSFSIPTGHTYALTGHNGSGKTTLLKALLGINSNIKGDITLLDHPITSLPYKHIGYIPQHVSARGAIPATALEVVKSGTLTRTSLFHYHRRSTSAKARELLKKVELEDKMNEHVQTFSGGQMQRVSIARALMKDIDLLILDEPLNGIDVHSRTILYNILENLKKQGCTIVCVLHDMTPLANLIDNVIELDHGSISFHGPYSSYTGTTTTNHHEPYETTQMIRHHAPTLTGVHR